MRDPARSWQRLAEGLLRLQATAPPLQFLFGGSAHIAFGYAAFRAGSFHAAKVDAELSRDPSCHWRCFHPRFRFL